MKRIVLHFAISIIWRESNIFLAITWTVTEDCNYWTIDWYSNLYTYILLYILVWKINQQKFTQAERDVLTGLHVESSLLFLLYREISTCCSLCNEMGLAISNKTQLTVTLFPSGYFFSRVASYFVHMTGCFNKL